MRGVGTVGLAVLVVAMFKGVTLIACAAAGDLGIPGSGLDSVIDFLKGSISTSIPSFQATNGG